jgi:hypothetical protein
MQISGKESDMLTGLVAVLLVAGILFVAVKVLFALVLIPLKIGFGVLKFLLLLLVGIPLLIFGCLVVGVALPFLIGGLVVAILIAPFVLLAKAIT